MFPSNIWVTGTSIRVRDILRNLKEKREIEKGKNLFDPIFYSFSFEKIIRCNGNEKVIAKFSIAHVVSRIRNI